MALLNVIRLLTVIANKKKSICETIAVKINCFGEHCARYQAGSSLHSFHNLQIPGIVQ